MPWFILFLALLILWGINTYWQAAHVCVGELEVMTVFTRWEGNFVGFLKPGHHLINPFAHRTGEAIPLGSRSTSGICDTLRTIEGIPVSIKYSVSFSVDPAKIMPGLEYKMARALPKNGPNMVAGKTVHALRHIIEQKSIHELYTGDAIKALEEEVRAEVSKRTVNNGVKPISASDMKLGPIEMPEQVETAIKTNYERKLQTTTSINALESLHEVISRFEDKHMQRLSELERLRIVENSGSLVYLMDSLVKKVRETADITPTNGSHN